MKSTSRFFVIILTICLLSNLIGVNKISAQPVDTDQAKMVAKNFFADILSRSKISNTKGISLQKIEMALIHEEKGDIPNSNDQKKGSQSLSLYYIFNVKDKTYPKDKNGFIIISADQRVPAVLGYSFIEEFSENDQAPAFKDWMDYFKEQITYAIQNNLAPDSKISDNWKKYSGTFEVKGSEQLTEVPIMLTTKWSQRSYYNNLCPADADVSCGGSLNQHVPAGCAAVAMAQIMKKHEYPAANNPIPGYVDPLTFYDFTESPKDGTSISYGSVPAIGATTYDWDNMVDDINSANPIQPSTPQINAVSTLIYHCGVALQMDYGPPNIGSGAGSPLNAFVEYFKYSPNIQEIVRSDYSDIDWTSKLKTELNNSRPVYYAGYKNDAMEGGHAFVCDGYQDVDPGSQGRFFHFNWGGGSVSSGVYFNLDNLTLGTAPNEKVYTYKQWAIIGITPGSGSSSTVTDIDGNQYNTVTIGEQTWMAENLKTTKDCDGVGIPLITVNSVWPTLTTPGCGWYNNDIANKDIYGALYNWYAVQSGKLCPTGWHVPSDDDWTILSDFLGGPHVAGGKLKEVGTVHWRGPSIENIGATDDYGFTALPGGYRHPAVGEFGGNFYNITGLGIWWSSTKSSTTNAFVRIMGWDNTSVSPQTAADLKTGSSVRCLKGPLVETIPGDAGAFAYGFIDTEGEENWFKFLTSAAGDYAIQTYGNTDTYMYLYNSDKTTLIAEDNDGAGAGNSKITQNLSANTLYYVKVTGYNSSTGSYQISVFALPEAPTASNQTICSDGREDQTLTAAATAPDGSTVVWFDAASEGNVVINPIQVGVGSITYYAASYNGANQCYSLTRTAVTLTIRALPTAEISGTSLICKGNPGNLIFNLTGTPPWSISFSDGTSDPVTKSNITNSSISVSVEPIVTSIYTLTAVNDAHCSGIFTGSANITINSDPVINSVTADPDDPIALVYQVATVNITANFADVDNNIKSVTYDFGDGSTPETIALNVTDISSQVSHTYNKTGVFIVNVTLSDDCSTVSMPYSYVVIYDPTGGFVTGGGWLNSPAGAYVPDPTLAGKASFGFESKYLKGASIPSGKTEFQFHAAGMNFISISYEWLVVAGSKAKFKGTGTINGTGSYGFMLTAIDGTTDMFRIKIWDLISEEIVYDNQMGASDTSDPTTAISGGSIVVHSQNGPKNMSVAEFGIKAYPNPFNDHIYFDIQLATDSKVSLEIYDVNGLKIAIVYNDIVVAFENYRFEYIPKNLSSGIIIYRFIVNGKQMYSGEMIHY